MTSESWCKVIDGRRQRGVIAAGWRGRHGTTMFHGHRDDRAERHRRQRQPAVHRRQTALLKTVGTVESHTKRVDNTDLVRQTETRGMRHRHTHETNSLQRKRSTNRTRSNATTNQQFNHNVHNTEQPKQNNKTIMKKNWRNRKSLNVSASRFRVIASLKM